eukprot:jgi/Ulvmu1/11089/UM070_0004.1
MIVHHIACRVRRGTALVADGLAFLSAPTTINWRSKHSYAIEPERTKEQALDLFNAFHRKNILSPNALLKHHSISLVFLPFWAFEAQGQLQYTATIRHPNADRSSQKVVTGTGQEVSTQAADAAAQVLATFELRRDLANGLKTALQTNAWCPVPPQLSAEDAKSLLRTQMTCNIRVLPADMHRGIAWALFLRALRQEHEPGLADWLKREHKSESVQDVHMDLELKSRTSKLVYVPGFLIDYQYGENQHGSIEIVAQHHQALIAAAGPEKVLAEPHYSPQKAQVATMAGALGAQAAAVGTFAAAGSADAAAAAVTIDSAFWAFLAASAAGVLARGFTGFMRDRHSTRVEAQADSLHAAYMRDGVSAYAVEDARDRRMRADAEWLRWEEGEVWSWDHGKRRRWAERLFAEQAARKVLSESAARRQAYEEELQRQRAQHEARRRARYGASHRHRPFSGGKRAGGRRDFKGYYKRLGLHAADEQPITEATVKEAYRRRVKEMHPDRHHGRPAAEQAAVRRRFQELQAAYEVLRDARKRKVYDGGGHVDH